MLLPSLALGLSSLLGLSSKGISSFVKILREILKSYAEMVEKYHQLEEEKLHVKRYLA